LEEFTSEIESGRDRVEFRSNGRYELLGEQKIVIKAKKMEISQRPFNGSKLTTSKSLI